MSRRWKSRKCAAFRRPQVNCCFPFFLPVSSDVSKRQHSIFILLLGAFQRPNATTSRHGECCTAYNTVAFFLHRRMLSPLQSPPLKRLQVDCFVLVKNTATAKSLQICKVQCHGPPAATLPIATIVSFDIASNGIRTDTNECGAAP